MKKIVAIFLIFCSALNVQAAVIDGGIEYRQEFSYPTEEYIANHYIDKNSEENIRLLKEGITKLQDREIGEFSDGTYGIMFYDDPEYSWYYSRNGRLINFTQKSSLEFPMKITKYKPDGTVVNTGIKISKEESYLYNNKGILVAHWKGNFCYDNSNNIIMVRKSVK